MRGREQCIYIDNHVHAHLCLTCLLTTYYKFISRFHVSSSVVGTTGNKEDTVGRAPVLMEPSISRVRH